MNFMLKTIMAGSFLLLAQGQAQATKGTVHVKMEMEYGHSSATYQAMPGEKDTWYRSNNHTTGTMTRVVSLLSQNSTDTSSLDKDDTITDPKKATTLIKMTRGSGPTMKLTTRAKDATLGVEITCYSELRFTNNTGWADYDAGRPVSLEPTAASEKYGTECIKKGFALGLRKGFEMEAKKMAAEGIRINTEKMIGSMTVKTSHPTVSRYEETCRTTGTKDRLESSCEPSTHIVTATGSVHF